MTFAQIVGGIGLIALWAVLAVANIQTLSDYGSDRVIFETRYASLTTAQIMGLAAIALDCILFGAIFAVNRWWAARANILLSIALVVWAACSITTWANVRSWAQTNFETSQGPAKQSTDAYERGQQAFALARKEFDWSLAIDTSKMGRRDLAAHRESVAKARQRMNESQKILDQTPVIVPPKAIPDFGFWFATIALTIYVLGWPAMFGRMHPQVRPVQTHRAPPSQERVTLPMTEAVTGSNISAVTPVPSPATEGPDTRATPHRVSLSSLKPKAPVTLPGTPQKAPGGRPPVTPSKGTSVVLMSDPEPAVRRWVNSRTQEDPEGFLVFADAWDDYRETCGHGITKDAFSKALSVAVGQTGSKQQRVNGKNKRGYPGLKLKERTRASVAKT